MIHDRLAKGLGWGVIALFVMAFTAYLDSQVSEASSFRRYFESGSQHREESWGPAVARATKRLADAQQRTHLVVPTEVKAQQDPADNLRYRLSWAYAISVRLGKPNEALRRYAEGREAFDQALVDRYVKDPMMEREVCKHQPKSEAPQVALRPSSKRMSDYDRLRAAKREPLITAEDLKFNTHVVKDEDGVRFVAREEKKSPPALPDEPAPDDHKQVLKGYVQAWHHLVKNEELTKANPVWKKEAKKLAVEHECEFREVSIPAISDDADAETVVVVGRPRYFVGVQCGRVIWFKNAKTWRQALAIAKRVKPREAVAE